MHGVISMAQQDLPLVVQDSFSLEASLLGSSGARHAMREGRSTAFGATLHAMSSSKPLVLPSTGEHTDQRQLKPLSRLGSKGF